MRDALRYLIARPLQATTLLLLPLLAACSQTPPPASLAMAPPAGQLAVRLPHLLAGQHQAAPVPADTTAKGLTAVWADLRRRAYFPAPAGTTANPAAPLAAANPAQRLTVALGAAYYQVAPATPATRPSAAHPAATAWQVGWHLRGVGRGGQLAFRPTAATASGQATEGQATFQPHPALAVDYDNTPAGVRQTFRLSQRPTGPTGPVRVELQLETSLQPVAEGRQALRFENKQGSTVLRYADLRAWDATGRALPGHLALGGPDHHALALVVDDANATYPLTIDPLATTPTSTLANPGMTDGDFFGVSVASAGDVNRDGYADVLVGAPGTSGGQGASYLYYGSATGLATSPAQTLTDPTMTADDNFGYSVAGAGDVNSDGYADVIIGAFGTNSFAGQSYLYYGSATGLVAPLTLTDPATPAGTDYFGNSVAGAGDVNGDGYADVVIGANLTNGLQGTSYLYYGSATGLLLAPVALPNPTAAAGDNFGISVAGAGDVNGDGYADVIIGASYTASGQGVSYLYLGSSSGLSNTAGTTAGTYQALTAPTPVSFEYFGQSVAGAGDVNGDGYADVIIGAPGATNDQGASYLFLGSPTGLGNPQALADPAATDGDSFGQSVAGAGDVNGDGYADVIIGAYGTNTNQGVSYLYLGSAAGLGTTVGTTAGTYQALTAATPASNDLFGRSVAGAGDVNGDGYGDVIIGAFGANNGQGQTSLYVGKPGSIRTTPNATQTNQPDPFTMLSDYFGYSVAGAGDVNADGYADVIIGSYGRTGSRGESYLYYGSATGLGSTVGTTAGTYQVLTSPTATADGFGYSVAGAGDVNGDGYGDVIIGTATASPGGRSGAGSAYLYHGSATGLGALATQLDGAAAGDSFGYSVAGAGDVDADGYADVIIGAYQADPAGRTDAGAAYFYRGSATGLLTTAARQLAGNAAGDQFGISVAGAGDVNGDGYADVIIGANYADPSIFFNAGSAYLYQGGAAGLGATPTTQLDAIQFDGQFGYSVAGAGDVDGDGYADVIVGALIASPGGYTEKGSAFFYRGSAAGLSTTATTQLDGADADFRFGNSVAGAGDVDGDGYADVIIGAYQADTGPLIDHGAAYLYRGSAAGLSATPVQLTGTADGQQFGQSVAGAGDVNGDGYADVLIGAPGTNSNQGASYLFNGNDLPGRRANLRVYNTNLTTPLTAANRPAGQFGIGLYARSAQGRVRARLVWEVVGGGTSFSQVSSISTSTQYTGRGAWANIPVAGVELKTLVNKVGRASRVRARLEYATGSPLTPASSSPANGTGGVGSQARYGPWQYVTSQQLAGLSTTPLPVELRAFTAELTRSGAAVQLAWVTASEKNSARFEVERSTDRETFKRIGTVAAAGSSTAPRAYQLTDATLPAGTTTLYYRLRQLDQDGTASYSPVRAVVVGPASTLALYPNPTRGSVQVSGWRAGTRVVVLDGLGRPVAEATTDATGTAQLRLPAGLPAGVYVVRGGGQALRLSVE